MAERDLPAGRFQSRQLGDPADELLLGDPGAVGHVEDLADGRGTLGRQEDRMHQVLDVDAIEPLVPRAEEREGPAPQIGQ